MTTRIDEAKAYCLAILEHERSMGHREWLAADVPPYYGYYCETCEFHPTIEVGQFRFRDDVFSRFMKECLRTQEARVDFIPKLRKLAQSLGLTPAPTPAPQPEMTAEEWVVQFCEANDLDWDKLTPGERTRVLMRVPCRIRCWRVGVSIPEAMPGTVCPECGSPVPVPNLWERIADNDL